MRSWSIGVLLVLSSELAAEPALDRREIRAAQFNPDGLLEDKL
jgi:hypothetical protein